jgi:hypothetical protein
MLDSPTSYSHVADNEVPRPVSAPDEQFVRQSLLTTLTDLDFDYERERNLVSSSTKDPNLRVLLLRKLAKKHYERRAPYIRHLQTLQANQTGERGSASS